MMIYLRPMQSRPAERYMIIGIYGHQDAGKTVLVERLVKALRKKKYKVASVKHTPHRKSVDCEGKDTWRHWRAGSDPVAFASEIETVIIKHSKMPMDDVCDIISRGFGPDVLIIEGFKDGDFPKVAIGNVTTREGTVLKNPSLAELVGYIELEVATERQVRDLPGLDCGKCGLDCRRLARAIVERKKKLEDCLELPSVGVTVIIGDNKIATGRFVSSIVSDTVRGMVSSLKGYEPGKTVEIRLDPKKRTSRTRRAR